MCAELSIPTTCLRSILLCEFKHYAPGGYGNIQQRACWRGLHGEHPLDAAVQNLDGIILARRGCSAAPHYTSHVLHCRKEVLALAVSVGSG